MRRTTVLAVEATRVVVTWHLVGYFAAHDNLQMSFQLILAEHAAPAARATSTWSSATTAASGRPVTQAGGSGGFGGTPAQAGFDFGDRRTYVALPYSRTPEVLSLCTTSNVGSPGVWRFRVRGGAVLPM